MNQSAGKDYIDIGAPSFTGTDKLNRLLGDIRCCRAQWKVTLINISRLDEADAPKLQALIEQSGIPCVCDHTALDWREIDAYAAVPGGSVVITAWPGMQFCDIIGNISISRPELADMIKYASTGESKKVLTATEKEAATDEVIGVIRGHIESGRISLDRVLELIRKAAKGQ